MFSVFYKNYIKNNYQYCLINCQVYFSHTHLIANCCNRIQANCPISKAGNQNVLFC